MKFFKFLDEELEDRVYKINDEIVDKDEFYDSLIDDAATDEQMIRLERKGNVIIGNNSYAIDNSEIISDSEIDYSEVNDDFGDSVTEITFHNDIDDCFDGECDEENVLHPVIHDTSVVDEDTPEAPTGLDASISNILINAITDEWNTIEKYNDIIQDLTLNKVEGSDDIIKVIKDIVNEENVHIGQLQTVLGLLSPNVESISKGEDEAEEVIEESPAVTSIPSPISINKVGNTLFGNVNPSLCGDDYDNTCLIADSEIDDNF